MLLQAKLGGRQKASRNRQQSGLTVSVSAPIDRNGFEAEIDGGEMGA
jgi:hypothetical protein